MKDVTRSAQLPFSVCRRLVQLSIAVVFFATGCDECKTSGDCSSGKICVDGKCQVISETDLTNTEESEPTDSSTASDTETALEKETDSESVPDGGLEACVDPETDCPEPGTCEAYTCVDGACETTALSNTPCQSDDNECTENICKKGECVASPLSDIACASDENDCTEDICMSGVCEHLPTSGIACESDENDCTEDLCVSGVCDHLPTNGAACASDDNDCTEDVCVSDVCEHLPTSGIACESDENDCTEDICVSGVCDHLPTNGAACESDDDDCTEDVCIIDVCEHLPTSGIACASDENDCTEDLCMSGVCEHLPTSGGACGDDGNACTEDVCDQGECGRSLNGASCDIDDNPCAIGVCQEEICNSVPMPDATPCDDGIWCNGTADQCESGECIPPIGSEPCDPETPCVQVVCHEPSDAAEGTCEEQLLDDVSCDDELFCNGEDICDDGVCTHVNPPCDDEVGICEVNVCDDSSDSCSVDLVPDGEPCREQDGLLCNGTERCQSGTCTAGSPFCPVFNDCSKNTCHEGEAGEDPTCDGIEPDRDHESCNTTLACDGEGDRYCLDGVCAHGETPACADLHHDGNLCTQYVICIEANDDTRCMVEKEIDELTFASIDCDQTVAFDTLTTNNEVTTYASGSCSGSFGGGEIAFLVATPEVEYTATLHVDKSTLSSEALYLMILTNPCDAANTCIQSSTDSVSSTNGTEDEGLHVIVVDGENGNRGFGTITLTCP